MLTHRLAGALLLAAFLPAAPQDQVDRERYAREYVQFQVVELDQWTKGFPHDYNLAVMKPPVDASKMAEAAKAGANSLRDSITRLATLTNANDLMSSSEFRSQMERTLTIAKEINAAMGSQRFPAPLQSDWDQIRSNLNNLARIYKLDQLAFLEAPGGGGRGGRGGPPPPPAGTGLVGYVVDQRCAAQGKGMWTNAACVARCVRDGDKVVLVTEEGKVYSISNFNKIEQDSYGQKVTLLGKVEGDSITVDSVK